jgi:Uma2 family endonuclease
VTVTIPHAGALTVNDLFDLPDDGNRYEIFDGNLLVTPLPAVPHAATTTNLRDRLYDQAPRRLRITQGVGVYANDSNYFIPDLIGHPT